MESSDTAEFSDRMRELRDRFAESLDDRIMSIQALWTAFAAAQGNADLSQELLQIVHRLAGSGGTFGYPDVSHLARSLEALLARVLADAGVPNDGQVAQVEELLAGLMRAAADGPVADLTETRVSAGEGDPSLGDILIADSEEAVALALAEQLSNFGYRARISYSAEELYQSVRDSPPMVGLIDLDLGAASLGGVLAAIRINAERGKSLPWFFMSRRDDLEARLRAIHAGGRAYFLRPVSMPDLLKALDDLLRSEQSEPYRVLVVEDDPAMALFATSALEHAGLQVRHITEAAFFLDTVSDFKPELVLMDLYLGNMLGTELALVLEQHDGYQNLPVVFLSAEHDDQARFEALDKGGDNFLLKPISPKHLVQAVRSRVRRARQVGTLVFSDGLTGLLNHRAIHNRMLVEFKRSQREKSELALAVLDIDLFKPVNDTHGHAVGDRVLQAMARMLTQRLRESDLVGRYGGEEFVVLFPNTSAAGAMEVLGEIRERFSRVRHNSSSGETFYVTFSGGIAAAAGQAGLQTLFDAADGALYSAKAAGRNQLHLADGIQEGGHG